MQMAAMVIHDKMIRRAFSRIAWASLGQEPNILELQRSIYTHFTGEMLPANETATVTFQLQKSQAACKGKRFLFVLDGETAGYVFLW